MDDDDQDLQEKMIQRQIVARGITEPRVLEALRKTPRADFLPEVERDRAFADEAVPIGLGQTISQPYIVALMTSQLDLRPDHKVLEVGVGSGYQTAILARLAGQIFAVERLKPLLDAAFERVLSMGLRNVHFRLGDGSLGWPEKAPFDRLIIAAAAPHLPRKLLLDQLAEGGVAIMPIGSARDQVLTRIVRQEGQLIERDVCPVRFVPLVGQAGWPEESVP
jgi:protein-L-isoaspartate(D-aspartate) O-methyltransferase